MRELAGDPDPDGDDAPAQVNVRNMINIVTRRDKRVEVPGTKIVLGRDDVKDAVKAAIVTGIKEKRRDESADGQARRSDRGGQAGRQAGRPGGRGGRGDPRRSRLRHESAQVA